MRALVIELLGEGVELALLSGKSGGRRTSGFGFQGVMHALVTVVLLRATGLNLTPARRIGKHPIEFKAKAVALSRLPGVEVRQVAESLGIHPFMLSRWRKEARALL